LLLHVRVAIEPTRGEPIGFRRRRRKEPIPTPIDPYLRGAVALSLHRRRNRGASGLTGSQRKLLLKEFRSELRSPTSSMLCHRCFYAE
jgi:hypothetical protein